MKIIRSDTYENMVVQVAIEGDITEKVPAGLLCSLTCLRIYTDAYAAKMIRSQS